MLGDGDLTKVKTRIVGRIIWSSLSRRNRTVLIPFRKLKEGYHVYTIARTLVPYIRVIAEEYNEEESITPMRVMLRVRGRPVAPEEAGFALGILSLVQLPRLVNKLGKNTPVIGLAYGIAGSESFLVASSFTYHADSVSTWRKASLKPVVIAIAVSQEPIDPRKAVRAINSRFKDDVEYTTRNALLIIKGMQESLHPDEYVVEIPRRPVLTLLVAPAFTTREIIVEYSDGIEKHQLTIPLKDPAWRITDFPDKIREEIEAIIVRPFKEGRPYAPRGAILIGPPGVGKSSLAEAIADAMGTRVIKLSPSTYRSMWYGATERILSSIFAKLRSRRDITVVIDDAEFITGRHIATHEVSISEVSLFLNILQDIERPFTILTSNSPELIDPAILRPGRIDIVILIGYPDREARKKAIDVLLRKYGIGCPRDVVEEIVSKTKWFTHAEIDALIRLAASRSGGKIDADSIEWAYKKFSINEGERMRIQEYLRWYINKLQGMTISFIPKETEM